MRCSCAQCRFSAYIDRDIDPDDEAELLEHLDQCAECTSELAELRECVETLRGMPAADPGADFYDCVRRKVHDSGERFAGERRAGLPARLRLPDLSGAWLRPALGAALGLVAGVLLAARAPQVTAILDGAAERGTTASLEVYERTAEQIARSHQLEGPLAGIDLPPLRGGADSLGVASEPEYVLEPYVADPHRGLVPVGRGYGRTASMELDAQNDAFVTF